MQYSAFFATLALPFQSTSSPLAERSRPTPTSNLGRLRRHPKRNRPSNYALTLEKGQDGGICGSFWDNLHGTCGDGITSTNCVSTNETANIAFTVPVKCQNWQIQNTGLVASEPHIGGGMLVDDLVAE
ncbi:hypothetical protein ABVK25_004178 [Lepraria finkii]|uniref:Uncharacterized protein n=1 Tax=Lepraria finkii TaxID=1340010 RepID=A0ABR4BC27_9LECA